MECTSAGPLRANSGHSRKSFNQLVWEIRNTASLAFCHARVLSEIKPIGCATYCETVTVRCQDMHGNTMRVFAYVRH